MSAMDRKPDIVCISSIDWDFIWQGHQEIMSTLAAARAPRAVPREHRRPRAERARSAARAPARAQLVARHQGLPRGAAEPVRLLAAAAAVAVLRGSSRWINRRCCCARSGAGCAPPASTGRSSGRSCRRRSRSTCIAATRSAADGLLLHRRFRVELARREADRRERGAAVPRRRSRLRHLRAAPRSAPRASATACTCFRSA